MSHGTPLAPIADDEAPTAFYRRRRKGSATPPRPSAAPRPSASPSPPTLLLPTSEARDVTSDGTILAPRQEGDAEVDSIERSDMWSRLGSQVREALTRVDTSSALAGVVAFTFFGLIGVAYVYVATSSASPPATADSAGTGAANEGAVTKALGLALRLRRAHGHDHAEVRHVP